MESEELKLIFQSIGQIESCKLIKNKTNQQSLCYGFVNYLNNEDAEKAIQTLNGSKIQNKIIKVSYARPSSEAIKGANLYIANVPKSWQSEDLNKYFSLCGNIITSRILIDKISGRSRGIAFLRFDQKFEAELAIQKLNGIVPDSFQEPILVKFANYPTDKNNGKLKPRQELLNKNSIYFEEKINNYENLRINNQLINNNLITSFDSIFVPSPAQLTANNSGYSIYSYTGDGFSIGNNVSPSINITNSGCGDFMV
jgi:ELAV/HuD family splicing factor